MNIKGRTALAGGYGLMVKQEESYAEDSFIKDEELSLQLTEDEIRKSAVESINKFPPAKNLVHGESRLEQQVDKIKEYSIACTIEKEVEAGGFGIEEIAKKQQSASEI
jgi:hypothetical protein